MKHHKKFKMIKIIIVFTALLIFAGESASQVENVPLSYPVYGFLKEMRVKRIISELNDDNPNLSRFEVVKYLDEIQMKSNELSTTEKQLLNKYMVEFNPDEINPKTTMSLFKSNMNVSNGFRDFFSNKQKYLFAYEKNKNNVFIDGLGHLYYINGLKPSSKSNSKIFDVGFRIRGTVFEHLGYNFSVLKGGAVGDSVLIESAFSPIKSTFKYVENIENIKNYDFAEGYLKYYFEPDDGMGISVQLGREKLQYGLGYSSRIALSGDAPNMDFLKFFFKYGIINYSSIFGSTVGEYSPNRDDRYSKYFTANRLKLSFENLFDIGIAETVISSRGIELGYLNPMMFYKFAEMSLQDRDNGTIFVDLQTHFLKNFEIQGTFFLDENILSNLSDLSKATNKTAYQLGFFWYEPAGINNLSIICEYTKIRPYVYSHYDPKNTYTSFGVIIGHPIGPNSDQIFAKLKYNLGDKIRLTMEYQHVRTGENITDSLGNLLRNVGGNVYIPYRDNIDSPQAYFLDGIRVNSDNVMLNVTYEPIRNFIFDLNYGYSIYNYITAGYKSDKSFLYGKLSINY